MGIKIKNRDPKSTDFSSRDIIINVNEGSLFYKSNNHVFKVIGDNLSTDKIEIGGSATGDMIYSINKNVLIESQPGDLTTTYKLKVVQDNNTNVNGLAVYESNTLADSPDARRNRIAIGANSDGAYIRSTFNSNGTKNLTFYSADTVAMQINTHITASGNISSSGIITAGSITSHGNLTFGNGGGRTITGPLNEDLILNARPNGADEGLKIQINGTDEVSILKDIGTTFANNITASNNISASGYVTAYNITASNNISSSGIITAEHFYSSDDAVFDDDVDIKGDLVVNKDDNRPIAIGSTAGTISIQGSGNWANYFRFKGSSGTDLGGFYGFGNADSLKRWGIASVYNSLGGLHVTASSGFVGIGTTSPAEALTVINNISASGDVYSNNHEVLYAGAFQVPVTTATTNWYGPGLNGVTYYYWSYNYGNDTGVLTLAEGFAHSGIVIPYKCQLVGFRAVISNRKNSTSSVTTTTVALYTGAGDAATFNDASGAAADLTIVQRLTADAADSDADDNPMTAVVTNGTVALDAGDLVYPRIKVNGATIASPGLYGTITILIKRAK